MSTRFEKLPYVNVSIRQEGEPFSPTPRYKCRLYVGIRHLHFAFRVDEKLCDRLCLPWHFIQYIRKSGKSSTTLYIYLDESKFNSPAFQSIMPQKYFPDVKRTIILTIYDNARKLFLKGLKMDGLVHKKREKKTKDKFYFPEKLEYKWQYLYVPKRPEFGDEDQWSMDNVRELCEIYPYEPYVTEPYEVKKREEGPEYVVPDEDHKKLNYPRITFEERVTQSSVQPYKSHIRSLLKDIGKPSWMQ